MSVQIFDRGDIVSFIGSFVVGLLGNMYSRVFKSTAFTKWALSRRRGTERLTQAAAWSLASCSSFRRASPPPVVWP